MVERTTPRPRSCWNLRFPRSRWLVRMSLAIIATATLSQLREGTHTTRTSFSSVPVESSEPQNATSVRKDTLVTVTITDVSIEYNPPKDSVESSPPIPTTKPQRTTTSKNSTQPRNSANQPPTEQQQQPVQRDPATNRVIVGGGLCPPENRTHNTTLAFIHIRKTGGTAIAQLVESFRILPKEGYQGATLAAPRVHHHSVLQKDRYLETTHRTEPGNDRHIPPQFFEPNPFANTATFVVTRDPYDRAVSEYYQRLKGVTRANRKRAKKGTKAHRPKHQPPDYDDHVWRDLDPEDHRNDAGLMNRWIREFVAHPSKDVHIPQHHYVFGDDDGHRRLVTHVLEFARLAADLDALLACYGIPLTLPRERVNPRPEGSDLSRANLTQDSIRTINAVLRKDFELLGYPVLEA